MTKRKFYIRDEFYLDGNPVKVISGGIHYFRIVKEYWRDRLEKLKAMGCNTVETYVPWNLHEPQKGVFNFEGMNDVCGFLELAAELELWVIFRPSPYICAEWEFGGLPGWLLAEEDIRLRSNHPVFMAHVRSYFKVLLDKVRHYQIQYGGPIIMMQVENEYGYYGDDSAYMTALKDIMVNNGVVVPLVTSDGPWGDALDCGKMEGILPTGNFGSKTEEQFEALSRHTEGGPLMCMEFWVGWFDHWGAEGHVKSAVDQNCLDLDRGLEMGHMNIYMFIGGTNFGFMNGANYYDYLTPDVTSYDYDAVLTEDGSITDKYKAFKEVIAKHVKIPEVTFTTDIKKKAYGTIPVNEKVSLFEVIEDLSQPVKSTYPMSMEKLGQNYGYILYTSVLKKESKINKLRLWDANDRVHAYVDGKHFLTLYDRELLVEHETGIKDCRGHKLTLLAENMGRVNFGPLMEKQRKGIDGGVQINGHMHLAWTHYPLPLDNMEVVDFSKPWSEGNPAFYCFEFEIEEKADTYIDMEGWGKGCVFINGFNLGRFWEIGPQKRLYLPGPLMTVGKNRIIIFETEGKAGDSITLVDQPDLGKTVGRN